MSELQIPQVTVAQFLNEHGESLELRTLIGEAWLHRVIGEPTVNRPGLVLAGHTRFFARHRVQVLGSAEMSYLREQSLEVRTRGYHILFSESVPCVVIARTLRPDRELLAGAERERIPVFRTPLITMKFINKATLALEAMFAPRGSEHGSMVDVHGIGVVIKGESGIGKSECVLALIERGYSFVADDVVKVRVHDGCEILATSAQMLGAMMEVRGIGIVDVEKMFGVKAVRDEKRVDLVVSLKPWNEVDAVERLGIEQSFTDILGIRIPHVTIPVRPGRDMARLIEVAAFQLKLRKRGHNAGQDLSDRLLNTIQETGPARAGGDVPREH